MIKILIKPRLHISLISMHADGYRVNGGIGFALEEPKGILKCEVSKTFEFNDTRNLPLSYSELEQIHRTVEETKSSLSLTNNISVSLEGGMLTHFGMGSGTAIRLGCLEALLILNKKVYQTNDLISYSQRGGTSGIGIHTYFSGGFVFDIGIKNQGKEFLPSSRAQNPLPPLVLQRIDMPHWSVGLCLPKTLKKKTQEEEIQFFRKTCPISPQESYKVLYDSLFGTYASLRENDFESFVKSIREIQACAWKDKERSEHGEGLIELERSLYDLGASCVGMSSLGPLLFFFGPNHKIESIKNGMRDEDCDLIFTLASNVGREIVK